MKLEDAKVAVIGLGYVGLPLAVEFGKQRPVIGYDINPKRVSELISGHDRTLEVDEDDLKAAELRLSADEGVLDDANVYIVTTPTPIDAYKQPDLGPLLSATRCIGRHLAPGDVVIYESTVYPGATEEECVPVLEDTSGLRFNGDFFVGYSPERINPGDKVHRVHNIVKVTSGSTPETAEFVDELYRSIVTVGTHRASSIRVAEAAKVIENTQRDVNIALMNELAVLFNQLGIDTEDVLRAAGSKWNFLPFRPGLVGGHCIGVDPYYLTHKAQAVGYHPEIILAGRRLNDSMGSYIVSQLIKQMSKAGLSPRNARVLVLGATFKENTPDLRNSRVFDIVEGLKEYEAAVDVHDPLVDDAAAAAIPTAHFVDTPQAESYEAVILAVAHDEFVKRGKELRRFLTPDGIFFDVKSVLPRDAAEARL